MMKPQQKRFQNTNSPHIKQANGLFCNMDAPLQPTDHPSSCITAIYAKNKAGIECQCSLQIWNTHSETIPMSITLNLWILTSLTELNPAVVTLICPDEAPKSIKVEKTYSYSMSTTSL